MHPCSPRAHDPTGLSRAASTSLRPRRGQRRSTLPAFFTTHKKSPRNGAGFFVSRGPILAAIGFEQPGGAHATANTHGDDAVAQVAALQFANQVADLT